MELVTVNIEAQALTARYGTLNPGDVVRTDAAFAKHLVEDAGCAKYASVPSADALQAPIESEAASPVKRAPRVKAAAAAIAEDGTPESPAG